MAMSTNTFNFGNIRCCCGFDIHVGVCGVDVGGEGVDVEVEKRVLGGVCGGFFGFLFGCWVFLVMVDSSFGVEERGMDRGVVDDCDEGVGFGNGSVFMVFGTLFSQNWSIFDFC